MVYDFFEELKDIINEKVKEFFSKSKYILLIMLFIVLVSGIFFCKKEEPQVIDSQQLKLLGITLENWVQWITLITIPYTGGWAFYQFRKSCIAKKQEKAVQIAKEFSRDLVSKCGIVNLVYTQSSLNDILKYDEKNYDDFKLFNVDELRKIYNNDDFPTIYSELRLNAAEELDRIYHYILLTNIISHNAQIVGIESQENNELSENDENDKKEDENEHGESNKIKTSMLKEMNELDLFVLQNSNYPYHFVELESNVLNQLEYICMDISSKATDSNFIYQSLHQMFLRTVRTLAAEMSVENLNYSDKYYTNIIHVYNDWTNRYKKDLKIERRKKEKINRILNPKIKTV